MKKQITIIVGAQWGDEGKGKITDIFAGENDFVVRFHGGNNAGHTLVVGKEVYKLHLVPSGILYPHTTSIIGAGVVVDPLVFLDEVSKLRASGLSFNLKISERAHIILPYHIAMDEALSGHQAELGAGSTKRGIAPVYADKMYRHGIRIADLLDCDIFKEKLDKAYSFNANILEHVFKQPMKENVEQIYEDYIKIAELIRPYVTDTEVLLHKAHKQGKQILFEGAQGMSLDPDHGMYPHTTSSNNVALYSSVGSGLGFNAEAKIIGVVKAYVSRVGQSPFPTELTDALGDSIREKGSEYGTTTGRARRIGWIDLVQIRQAVRTSGLTDIALTKADILSGLNKVRICTAYSIQGKVYKEMPASLSKMRLAKPIYVTLPGWGKLDTPDWQELPSALKGFIQFIEQEVACKISIVSTGPERSQTIHRD